MQRILTLLLITGFMVASCKEEKQTAPKTNEGGDEDVKKVACSYTYSPDSTKINWTAYKFNEKLGVGGTFDEVTIFTAIEEGSLHDLITGITFNIATNSVNSNNPDRDKKIAASFFGSMADANLISGKLISLNGNDASGKVEAEIKMNESTQIVQGNYSLENGNIEMSFELNVSAWGADASLDALNKVCEDLHKGADGESKLWPDVSVKISGFLNATCE